MVPELISINVVSLSSIKKESNEIINYPYNKSD